MKAEARELTFLSAEGLVRIPFFQREYVWGEENWEELLENLGSTGRSHFLGSLILKQQQAQSGAPKEVLVIDGQQRLTTLSLLTKALYDSFSEEVRRNALVMIRAVLFFQTSILDDEFQVKIQHSHVDREDFERIIRAGIDAPPLDPSAQGGRIFACYRYFEKRFLEPEWGIEQRRALFRHLLDQQNKMLVVIDLAATDDEQSIFDTINSAGVRLSASDIIKNSLYQRAIAALGQTKAVALYEKTWKETFTGDQDAVVFWSADRVTGRMSRDNMELLLHAIAVADGFYDPVKHTMGELSSRYKERIGDLKTEADVRGFAGEISECGEIYREHFGAIDRAHHFKFSESTARLMHVLDAFQVSTLHPLVLHALRQPEPRASQLLRQIERFVVRRVVADAEMRSLNKLAKEMISNPSTLDTWERNVTDDMVRRGLRNMFSNKVAAVVLFWVELRRRSVDAMHDVKDLPFAYTLEHVMPQKWKTHWGSIPPRARADGSDMSAEELAAARQERVYWLGNMTLLTGSLNSSLKNASFERKVLGDGRKKGIKAYASLSVSKEIVDAFENDKTWDEAKIEARQAKLEAEVLALWPAPLPAAAQ